MYLSSRVRYSWSCAARVPLAPLHKDRNGRLLLAWSCRGPLVVADQVCWRVSSVIVPSRRPKITLKSPASSRSHSLFGWRNAWYLPRTRYHMEIGRTAKEMWCLKACRKKSSGGFCKQSQLVLKVSLGACSAPRRAFQGAKKNAPFLTSLPLCLYQVLRSTWDVWRMSLRRMSCTWYQVVCMRGLLFWKRNLGPVR